VPPTGYGGIERVVALLADRLVEAGHDVTLFATGDSRTRARLASLFPVAPTASIGVSSIEVAHALSCLVRADEFDLVNDHSGPPAAALGGLVSTPVLHTVHGPLDAVQTRLYRQIARVAPRVGLISLCLHQRRPAPDLPWVANCPNGVDLEELSYRAESGAYALFLGRVHPSKGAHRAVEAAAQAGVPLVLAGKARDPDECAYLESKIRPRLGRAAVYLGEV
jgi:glycosyltransferase involved in cell wall biosynthesis